MPPISTPSDWPKQPGSPCAQRRGAKAPQAAGHVARFDYEDLCRKPLGAADFVAIAEYFQVLLIDNIRAIHHPVTWMPGDTGFLKATLAAPPTVGIALVTPICVRSLKHGRVLQIRTIGIRPDDPDHFLRATADLIASAPS